MSVYKRHDVAKIFPGDITIGASRHVAAEGDDANWSSDLLVNHAVELTVRAHTGYEGDVVDRAATTLLLDQILHTLKTNVNMTNYRLMEFEVTSYNSVFDESKTTGGEMLILLHRIRLYTQS